MAKIIGRQVNVGIGKESTRGTAVAPTQWIKQTSVDFDDKVEYVTSLQSNGVLEDSDGSQVIRKWAEGKIEGYVSDQSIGLLLLSMLGSVASAIKETTAYNHTFTVLQSATHPTLTVDIKNGANEHLAFPNSVVTDLELKYSPKEYVQYSASFKGKSGAASVTTPAYVTENTFIGKHVVFKTATNQAGLTAASPIVVHNLSLKITKGVDADEVLGSVDPSDFYNGALVITGSVDLSYDDATYKALALAGTNKAIRLDIQDTTTTIGATSNPGLQIDLYSAKFVEYSLKRDLKGLVNQSLNFKAYYSPTDTKMISAILTNTKTTY
jgi:hypothetical protein